MTQTLARLAGCAAMLAALILAPPALAGTAKSQSPSAKARQLEKQCGKAKRASAASKCVSALRKLASGKSSSPRVACAGLSRKGGKGAGKSAYARCVAAGAKLVKQRKAAASRNSGGGDESADAGDSGDAGAADAGDDEPDDPAGEPLDGGVDDDLADFGDALDSADPDFP